MRRAFIIFIFLFLTGLPAWPRSGGDSSSTRPYKMLLRDQQVQIQATEAVNQMYNFKFKEAEKRFFWLKQKYPEHPLPYFLMGLNHWWKIVPNDHVRKYDDELIAYMDTSIHFAEKMYERHPNNIEATFFLAAAYGFKGRLYSERRKWSKATVAGKKAVKFLHKNREKSDLSPEFLFGDALYNYYAEWIPENYVLLKPVVAFFPDGDKQKGIKQLYKVAHNAFYTRTEAQYFLMRILALEEEKPEKAYPIAKYLAETFPDNAYFRRFYAKLAFNLDKYEEAEKIARAMYRKCKKGYPGYTGINYRYATYYLGFINESMHNNKDTAKFYFQKHVQASEEMGSVYKGYYHYSLAHLARMADEKGNTEKALKLYKKIKKRVKRRHPLHEEARNYEDEHGEDGWFIF